MVNYICNYNNKIYKFDKVRNFIEGKVGFSVVLPTYNEEKNIKEMILALNHYLKGLNFEIIAVDDASNDKTPSIINGFSKQGNLIALHRKNARNIFTAIKDGIKISRGEFIVVMDSDFSHPPKLVPVLISYLKDYDLVAASRFLGGYNIKAPFIKKYGTIIFNVLCKFILKLKLTDITGGFRAIKKSKFYELNLKYPSVWGEFNMEVFYRARKKKFRIKEIPYIYIFRRQGVSSKNILRYMASYFLRALKLRFFG